MQADSTEVASPYPMKERGGEDRKSVSAKRPPAGTMSRYLWGMRRQGHLTNGASAFSLCRSSPAVASTTHGTPNRLAHCSFHSGENGLSNLGRPSSAGSRPSMIA